MKQKLTPKQIELLRKLSRFPDGSAYWTNLSSEECASGTRLMNRGLTVWVSREGGRYLHITGAGREALKEIGK